MHAKRFSALMIALLFLMTVPSGLGSGLDEDREAFYMGSWTPPPPPTDAQLDLMTVCDTEVDGMGGSGIHGFGGVLFCDVPQGETVTIIIGDLLLASPAGLVTCQTAPPDPLAVTHSPIGTASPTLTFQIPAGCIPHPDDKSGSTRIGVFLTNGWAGTVTLTFE